MDYYSILKIAPNASRKEIDEAFKRLMKECRYNAQLNRREIEAAFKILSNTSSRKAYDSKKEERVKIDAAVGQMERRRSRARARKSGPRFTFRQKVITLAVLFPLAVVFYIYRFGYQVKQFEPGDVVYYKHSKQILGKIVAAEDNHDFGQAKLDAFLIEWDSSKKQDWVPQVNVKSSCFKISEVEKKKP